MSEQQIDTKHCPKCKQTKSIDEFHKVKSRKDGLAHKCKSCISQNNKQPDSVETRRNYIKRNKTHLKKYYENWNIKNKNKLLETQKRFRINRKIEIINYYGGKCECCGEKELDFLAIDHKNGGGTKHRNKIGKGGGSMYYWIKKQNFPVGFRVLCHNCNWGIHINKGIC